jgi:hypothetical protein
VAILPVLALVLLVLLPLVLAAATWLRVGRGLFRLRGESLLGRALDRPPGGLPRLSIVVACRDEGETVEPAMRSLLAQRYPGLEIIAVDDRSTDETSERLEALAAEDPRLRVLHVRELPAGWLGKNHALSVGAAGARGEWLLFTDADIVFAPDALERAVAWALAEGLGHGVVLPRFVTSGALERAFVAFFVLVLLTRLRVDELRRAGSRAFIGIGAFNLVRAADYARVGGHARLAMEIADDIKLGLVLRRSGVRQGCIEGGGLVRVRWQRGFAGSVRGLVKNIFAGNEYSWARTLAGVAAVLVLTVLPLVALLLGPGTLPRLLGLATLLLALLVHAATVRWVSRGSGLEALALPIAGASLAGAALASALLATLRGGVIWRRTRYPLDELRARCVREADWPAERAPG